jgi:dTDP-glucose 4,6-dehydratase
MSILVTGGAGFIGSNFVLDWLAQSDEPVINLDKLTYAGNAANLASLSRDSRHQLVQGDIGNREQVRGLLQQHRPRAVVHFAAESHVDRSIDGPGEFIQTNVVGTFSLLEEARGYWNALEGSAKQDFRFLHVSTDEVYGSLEANDPAFSETTAFSPNSPYAASKAGSDHLVRAWFHTYGFPALTTNCSNNYGPFQFPEKLIPLMILNALDEKPLPVYGDGLNVRDWLHVRDHCSALRAALARGKPGETYNIGGRSERNNLQVVHGLIAAVDAQRPSAAGSRQRLIQFVKDRPGHDRRYAVDCSKAERELGWQAQTRFEQGLADTVAWYLSHQEWVNQVRSGEYRQWIEKHYQPAEKHRS